jgi:hypothetical protein
VKKVLCIGNKEEKDRDIDVLGEENGALSE